MPKAEARSEPVRKTTGESSQGSLHSKQSCPVLDSHRQNMEGVTEASQVSETTCSYFCGVCT